MMHDRSGRCESAGEQAQVSDKQPSGGAGDACLEVFGEPPAAAQPGEAALDDPSPGQQLKAFDAGRTLDNLDGPGAAVGDGALQLLAAVDPIGEDMAQLGEGLAH